MDPTWKWRWPKRFKDKESYWKRAENEADPADLRRLQAAILPVANYVPQQKHGRAGARLPLLIDHGSNSSH